jgi:hypothetical protein
MMSWLKNTGIAVGSIIVWSIGGCVKDNIKESREREAEEAQRKLNQVILEARHNIRSIDDYREGVIKPQEGRIILPAKYLQDMSDDARTDTLSWAFATKVNNARYLGHVTFGSAKENINGRRIVLNDPGFFIKPEFLANVASNGLGIIFNNSSYGDSSEPVVDYFISRSTNDAGTEGITVKMDVGADGKDIVVILEHKPN